MATILTNAHIYCNKSLFGKVEEFQMPDAEAVTIEQKTIDSIGSINLPIGVKFSDGNIKLTGFDSEVFAELSDMTKEHIIIVRGDLKTFVGATLTEQKAVKGTLRATTKKITQLGTLKGQENAQFSVDLNPVATKLEHNGVVLSEIDIANNIWVVNGVDKLSKTKSNLGLV